MLHRSITRIPFLAALLLAVLLFPTGCGGAEAPKKGATANQFQPIDAAGIRALPAESPGKVVLVCFWATWCPSCRTEMTELAKLRAAYKPEDLRMVAVSLDESAKALPKFFGGEPALEIRHGSKDVVEAFNLNAIPHLLIYGRNGKVVFNRPGAYPESMLDSIIKGLVAQ